MLSAEYIAGFFDGEGCIDIRYRTTHGGKYQRFELRLTISQVFRLPLDKIAEQWGGSISPRRSGNIHYYVVTGKQANALLTAIRPHLLVKADEADIALSFYKLTGKNKSLQSPETIKLKATAFYDIRQARLNKGVASKARKIHNINYG